MEINIKRLLKDLSNPDDDLRTLSAMTLFKIEILDADTRETVLKELIKSTHDKNVSVRFFASRAIDKLRRLKADAKTQTPDELVPIDEALQSEDYEQRLNAVMRISKEKKSEYKDQLIEMLKTEYHDFVKASLISCLKNFLDKSQSKVFTVFLSDPDRRVRSNAIEALETLHDENSIPLLFSALEDTDNRIRASAAKALAAFGEEKVFAILKKMLQSNDEWMKVSSIHALSHINSGTAITMLVDSAKSLGQIETRLKAIIALANYQDSFSHSWLKLTSTTGDEPFKTAALKSLKLYEEKFGVEAPTSSLIKKKDTPAKSTETAKEKPSKQGDLSSSVATFFRKGKEEAVGLSQNAMIKYALNDLQNEQQELLKEIGRVVFEIYQAGDLQIPELLTQSHEILRMNYFIQKYSEEEHGADTESSGGFFAQIRNLFGKSQPKTPKQNQAEKFTQKREELFIKLGHTTFEKYRLKEYMPHELEGYYKAYVNLDEKIQKERTKFSQG
ncbi:MAG: HEAT repeat domain-containing protein [Candidatus Riflebacteria bacterium]|nr:HEAT repeat domain-containing protein [Candidatus Riflebacteria bacterium]